MSNFFSALFNSVRPAQSSYPKDSDSEPAQISLSKVLVIVYDPVMDKVAGTTLSQQQKWFRPADLITGFMADLTQVSAGMARYQIVQRIDADEFPAKTDGFQYNPKTYMDVLNQSAPSHTPEGVNYNAILNKYNILQRVAKNEIDEVWTFSFPHAGFYESTMGGPDAFWCNAPPLSNTSTSKRRFVVMGFSFERQVGEMLEGYGHRAESVMKKVFSKTSGEANLWDRFTRYEKIAPGKAACGTIHFAPNSQKEYEWNNPTRVSSECYDWQLNFPNFKGDIRVVGPTEWGSGDIRAHHKWWLNHFPGRAGRKNGVHNNWWQYVVKPQLVVT